MTISIPHYSLTFESRLGWKEFALTVADDSPDELIQLRHFGGSAPLDGVRNLFSQAPTFRIPTALLPPFFSLVGVKADSSKAYIALGIDAAADLEITLAAVDETGGGDGGGTGEQARLAGTVTIDATPVAREIVIVDDDPGGRKVVGAGQSATDGTFDIQYDDTGFPVIVIALDQYGVAFAAGATLNEGVVVHPATPNGYVYVVSVAGTTGNEEPAWSTTQSIQSGSVTFAPQRYYRPIASGPLEGEPVV